MGKHIKELLAINFNACEPVSCAVLKEIQHCILGSLSLLHKIWNDSNGNECGSKATLHPEASSAALGKSTRPADNNSYQPATEIKCCKACDEKTVSASKSCHFCSLCLYPHINEEVGDWVYSSVKNILSCAASCNNFHGSEVLPTNEPIPASVTVSDCNDNLNMEHASCFSDQKSTQGPLADQKNVSPKIAVTNLHQINTSIMEANAVLDFTWQKLNTGEMA